MIIGLIILVVVIGILFWLIKTAPEYDEAENGTFVRRDKNKTKETNEY
jgi:hypothetical protein